MTIPPQTLGDLFGTYATDPEVMRLAMEATWPSIMRVANSSKTRPVKSQVTTSEIKAAIEHVVECDPVKRIILVSNAGSAFAYGPLTDYCTRLPYGKSLAVRLLETHRRTLRRRFETVVKTDSWITFSEKLRHSLNFIIGRPLIGPDGYWPQDPQVPKSSVADAFLTMLYSTLAYGVIGETVSVKMFTPILGLAPTVIPIGEQGDMPGTWVCAIVGSPVAIISDI